MAISFACPGCGKKLKVGDEHAGKKSKCPGCGQVVAIPAAGAAVASGAAAGVKPAARPAAAVAAKASAAKPAPTRPAAKVAAPTKKAPPPPTDGDDDDAGDQAPL